MRLNEVLKRNDPEYQIKVGSKWHDVNLPAANLQEIANEISASSNSKKSFDALPIIHALVKYYHLGPSGNSVDEDYEVITIKNDTLKINYSFTDDKHRDKQFRGELTIMPASE